MRWQADGLEPYRKVDSDSTRASISNNGSIQPDAITSSQTWRDAGFIDGNWETKGNWFGSPVPGVVGMVDTNNDIASFGYAANLLVTLNTDRSLGGVTFFGQAGAFTLQGANLYLAISGSIYVKNGVSHVETVNNSIDLPSTAGAGSSFYSDSTAAGSRLVIGGAVIGRQASGSVGTLSLGGNGSGTILGEISDGAAGGKLAVTKESAGTRTLSGTNKYTGTTTVTAGTLLINGNQALATGAVTASGVGSLLGGMGKIGGSVTITAGASLTGASSGTVGTLTLSSTATF